MFYLVANGINFLLMKKICAIMAILFFVLVKKKGNIIVFLVF